MTKESFRLKDACVGSTVLLQLVDSVKNQCEILHTKYKTRPHLNRKTISIDINSLATITKTIKQENYVYSSTLQNLLGSVINSASLTILFFFIATVMCSIFLSAKIASSITNPLAKLMDSAQKIVEGNLSVRLNVNKYDEIGTLSMVFNKMVDTLRRMSGGTCHRCFMKRSGRQCRR